MNYSEVMSMKSKVVDGDIALIKDNFRVGLSEYRNAHKKMRMLDATDNADLWKAINVRYPRYQVLPDTNHVAYIKNNILASIYTVGKCANIIPTSDQDNDLVQNLNNLLTYLWGKYKIHMYQMRAGERAALLNLGITQVGWDNNTFESVKPLRKGQLKFKNVDPMRYVRDPYADSLETASFVITWDRYHSTVLASHTLYGEQFKKLINDKSLSDSDISSTTQPITDKATQGGSNKKDYYTVYTHFVRRSDGSISEIHALNNEYILHKIDKIQPNMMPFAELYCNLPNSNLVGTSEPAKIFANSLAYNILTSTLLTA